MALIRSWDAATFDEHVEEAMAIYVAAMGYANHAGRARGRAAHGQSTFPGFRARGAFADDASLIGFCYGYTSEHGQWWHELVRRAVPAPLAAQWLDDCFELSELHVLPSAQGAGVGRDLLLSLAQGLPHHAMVLSTPDADTRARRLYHRLGFIDLATNYLFPGESRPFAVLGRRLPFEAPTVAACSGAEQARADR